MKEGTKGKRGLIKLMVGSQAVFLLILGLVFYHHVAGQYLAFTGDIGSLTVQSLRSESMVELLYDQKELVNKRITNRIAVNKWLEYVFVLKSKRVKAEPPIPPEKGKPIRTEKEDMEVFVSGFRSVAPLPIETLKEMHLSNTQKVIEHEKFRGFTATIYEASGTSMKAIWGYMCIGLRTAPLVSRNTELMKSLLWALAITWLLSGFVITIGVRRIQRA